MLKTGCGALMGDPFAVKSFSRAFRPPNEKLRGECIVADAEEEKLVAVLPAGWCGCFLNGVHPGCLAKM